MNLFFLRHGESETNAAGLLGGWLDKPLTAKGIAQAEEAIDAVRELAPDVIYSSPLLRARKTAEIVSAALGMKDELIIDDRLKERGAGVMEGQHDEDGKHLVSTLADDVEGAETIQQLHDRAKSVIEEIMSKNGDKTVLIVGHGAQIKMTLSVITDQTWEELRDTVLPNGVPFQSFEEVSN